jgi:hypothetical protein
VLRVYARQGRPTLTRTTDVSSSAAAVDMLFVSVFTVVAAVVGPSFFSLVGIFTSRHEVRSENSLNLSI